MAKHYVEDSWRTPIQNMEIGDKLTTKYRTITRTDVELGALLGGDYAPQFLNEEAAKESGLIHAVNYHNRFYPANSQLRNMIRDGALGRIYGVQGSYLQDCFSKETDFNWRMLAEYGGKTRVTSDIGSHWIDLAEYFTGSRVKEVLAEFQTVLPTRKVKQAGFIRDVKVDTEDTSYIMLRFENGAVGSATFS